MKKLTFLLLIALMPMMASAQNAYKKAYEKAKKAEMSQSSTMTAEEMYKLGLNYYEGKNGKTQNYTEAVKWFRQAAEQGNAKAQNYLGYCYEKGHGVTQSDAEAQKWYRKAAEQGNATAQYNLGACYNIGRGVTRDYVEAVKWYRKAADNGSAKAQNYLGYCYEKGHGVTQSDAEAQKWYRKAAEEGNASAQNNLGTCYYIGRGVTRDYIEAVKWYRKAADKGSASAQYNLGICYEYGNGVTKDKAEAMKWYRKAADKGYEVAKKKLPEQNQSTTTAATAKAMNPPTPNSLTKKIVMERRYLVNKANNYCYPATCFRMDNNLQLEIRYFNTDHYQGSYSVTRHGIYIAVGRCEDVNFDWNVKDCDYFDAWHVCAVTTDQWVNEKIEFDESGNVSYYMNGKYMGTHMFEMLKKLAGSKTVTFDINPYGWYTGQHHYMDDLKLTLPGKTISDNFNDGVIDSKIWQTPTNPSGVREEGGILKTEQVRTDWPYHLRTIALSLTGGSQNSSSNSTLAQKTTMTVEEMYKLGLNYYEGKNGKTQNYTEAVKWFRQAAEQGNAKAQNFMGVCCYNGSGVTQDYNEALKWYRKAAEQGYAIAQSNLGACYYNGKIVTRDYTEALKWYRKAAEQGNATAQYNVGNCYEYGNGVTKDNFQAAKWYRKAAEQNNENAKKKLAGLNLSSITAGATAQSKSSETSSQDTSKDLLIAGALEMVAFDEAVEKTDYAKYTASSQAAFNYFKRVYAAANNKWPDIVKDAQDGALEIYERTQGLSVIAAVYYVQKEYRKAFDAFYVARKAFKEPVLTSNPQAQNAIKECSRDSVINDLALKCAGIALYDLKDTVAAIKELVLLKNRVNEKKLMNEVYQNLATIYYEKDDSASYESILKEGAEKMPNEPWYITNLINYYNLNGDYVSANKYLDKAITKDPNSVHYNRLKGYTLEQQGKVEAALPFYEKAIKLDPNDLTTITLIGLYYVRRAEAIQDKYNELKQYEEGNRQAAPFFEKALPYYEKAWSLDKENKGNGYVLSTLYDFKAQQAGENTPEGKLWIEKWKKLRTELGIE